MKFTTADAGVEVIVEQSRVYTGAAYLTLSRSGSFVNGHLTEDETRELRDVLADILGESRYLPAPDALHGDYPEETLSPVVEARLEIVRQLVELGVEAGDIPDLLDSIAGELPGTVAVQRFGQAEPDYYTTSILPCRG